MFSENKREKRGLSQKSLENGIHFSHAAVYWYRDTERKDACYAGRQRIYVLVVRALWSVHLVYRKKVLPKDRLVGGYRAGKSAPSIIVYPAVTEPE